MDPFEVVEGQVAVLDRADVDTDQIIPKQFLKRIERTGFGEFLFYDWFRSGEIELEPHPILVAGRNFGEALKAGHKMAFQQVHSLGRVLMQAVGALHAKGLVHGSIQPSNVMVAQGVVKLTDLGLGRFAHRLPGPGYRAPESQLDKAGDLYAVLTISVPATLTDREKALYEELRTASRFDPRARFR